MAKDGQDGKGGASGDDRREDWRDGEVDGGDRGDGESGVVRDRQDGEDGATKEEINGGDGALEDRKDEGDGDDGDKGIGEDG